MIVCWGLDFVFVILQYDCNVRILSMTHIQQRFPALIQLNLSNSAIHIMAPLIVDWFYVCTYIHIDVPRPNIYYILYCHLCRGGKHHNICCNFSYEMFVAQWQSMVTKSGRKGIATIAMQKCIGHSSYSLERDIGSAIRLVSACASVFNSLSFTRQS